MITLDIRKYINELHVGIVSNDERHFYSAYVVLAIETAGSPKKLLETSNNKKLSKTTTTTRFIFVQT